MEPMQTNPIHPEIPTRREFLKKTTIGAAALASGISSTSFSASSPPQIVTANPEWRGFNLQHFFGTWSDGVPREDDFRIISDLGFNFARIPLWYINWIEDNDPYKVKEDVLEEIDKDVEFGLKHGIHVCLNFHRAPGYCVAKRPVEPFILWKDQKALDAFCFHWNLFAERYKQISGEKLSFNLVNEPLAGKEEYERVARAGVKTIREVSPDRLIIVDGNLGCFMPCFEVEDLNVIHSCRGYLPHALTHYQASWMPGGMNFPEPTWPGVKYLHLTWDRQLLERAYGPWKKAVRDGLPVHCGECGCYSHTPHDVFLRWFRDVLEILSSQQIRFALWELRGTFGILDSQRKDVAYEDWHGHQLDRKLLDLIQSF